MAHWNCYTLTSAPFVFLDAARLVILTYRLSEPRRVCHRANGRVTLLGRARTLRASPPVRVGSYRRPGLAVHTRRVLHKRVLMRYHCGLDASRLGDEKSRSKVGDVIASQNCAHVRYPETCSCRSTGT